MQTLDNIPLFSSSPDRTKPNHEDVFPQGIPFQETNLPESKLCQVASAELPALPHLWQ